MGSLDVDSLFTNIPLEETIDICTNTLFKNTEKVGFSKIGLSFTIKSESQNRMSFLGLQIIREDKSFTTSVCCKPTFNGVYTHFDSFLPSTYKFGTVYTLVCRCLRICSRWTKLHNELVSLKHT